jgi:hypothetical protein
MLGGKPIGRGTYVRINLPDLPNDPSDHAGLVEGCNHHDDDGEGELR